MKKQSGAVIIIFALLLAFMLLPLSAMVIDAAYIHVVKTELQTAADAGAMAGANYLIPPPTSTDRTPQWATATTSANNIATTNATISLRTGAGTTGKLLNATVTSGYYDTANPSAPLTTSPGTITNAMYPAVRVEVARADTQNNGPLPLFLASIFGMSTTPVRAKAMAYMPIAGSIGPGGAYPLAISECAHNFYLGQTAGTKFKVGNRLADTTAGNIGCITGYWTSLTSTTVDANALSSLIETKNTQTVKIGDLVAYSDAELATLYQDFGKCIAAIDATKRCVTIPMPVLQPLNDGTSRTRVIRIACVRLDSVEATGDVKHVLLSLTSGCRVVDADPADDDMGAGAYATPRLAE